MMDPEPDPDPESKQSRSSEGGVAVGLGGVVYPEPSVAPSVAPASAPAPSHPSIIHTHFPGLSPVNELFGAQPRSTIGAGNFNKQATTTTIVVGTTFVAASVLLFRNRARIPWDHVGQAVAVLGSLLMLVPEMIKQHMASKQHFDLESLNGQFEHDIKAMDALLQSNNRDIFGEHIPIQALTMIRKYAKSQLREQRDIQNQEMKEAQTEAQQLTNAQASVPNPNEPPSAIVQQSAPPTLLIQPTPTTTTTILSNKQRAKAHDKSIIAFVSEQIALKTPVRSIISSILRGRVFVVDFDGDVYASNTSFLKQVVTFIISIADPQRDRVVIRLYSGGGAVPHYGHAAAQLARLKHAGIKCTVCVDHVAASGGYMMACVASEIIASPFAMIGSIGVLTEIPNIATKLKKNDIDWHLFTAGAYKRTVTMFNEVTTEAKQHLQNELVDIHTAFKQHIVRYRPSLSATIDSLSTGEVWLGSQALSLGLVDSLMTSDQYLSGCVNLQQHVIHIKPKPKHTGGFFGTALATVKLAAQQAQRLIGMMAPLTTTLPHMTQSFTNALHNQGASHDMSSSTEPAWGAASSESNLHTPFALYNPTSVPRV